MPRDASVTPTFGSSPWVGSVPRKVRVASDDPAAADPLGAAEDGADDADDAGAADPGATDVGAAPGAEGLGLGVLA
jgi:hypothetical protein